MTAPWTEAHEAERHRRTYEIAATLRPVEAVAMVRHDFHGSIGEAGWRRVLDGAGLDPARIDREVRRVRGLARGRLMRETWWRVGLCWYADRDRAKQERRDMGAPMFRVTRIRRAS